MQICSMQMLRASETAGAGVSRGRSAERYLNKVVLLPRLCRRVSRGEAALQVCSTLCAVFIALQRLIFIRSLVKGLNARDRARSSDLEAGDDDCRASAVHSGQAFRALTAHRTAD